MDSDSEILDQLGALLDAVRALRDHVSQIDRQETLDRVRQRLLLLGMTIQDVQIELERKLTAVDGKPRSLGETSAEMRDNAVR